MISDRRIMLMAGCVGGGLVAALFVVLSLGNVPIDGHWQSVMAGLFFAALLGGGGWWIHKDIATFNDRQRVELYERQAVAAERNARALQLAAPVQAAPAAGEYDRLIPVNHGESSIPIATRRSARWLAWQAFGLAFLDWAELRHGCTADKLVGAGLMFSAGQRGAWVAGTNGLRKAGLVSKANGSPTELVGDLDQARARVRAGDVRWPDDFDPPKYLPALTVVGAQVLGGVESEG